jgi:hypothetical protein
MTLAQAATPDAHEQLKSGKQQRKAQFVVQKCTAFEITCASQVKHNQVSASAVGS